MKSNSDKPNDLQRLNYLGGMSSKKEIVEILLKYYMYLRRDLKVQGLNLKSLSLDNHRMNTGLIKKLEDE